jgi:hypothetical protein
MLLVTGPSYLRGKRIETCCLMEPELFLQECTHVTNPDMWLGIQDSRFELVV